MTASVEEDIFASLLKVDNHTSTIVQVEKRIGCASSEDDIMSSLIEVDNNAFFCFHRDTSELTDHHEKEMGSASVLNSTMAFVKQSDQCVAVEQSYNSTTTRLSTSTDDSDLKPILLNSRPNRSSNPFEMITHLFDQCFHGLFSFTNDMASENIIKGSVVKHQALRSNDSLGEITAPAPRTTFHVSKQTISLDHTEIHTGRRVLFKMKEKQNASSWAKRFEDPSSDLIDSMQRLRLNTNSRRIGRKASKIRLVYGN